MAQVVRFDVARQGLDYQDPEISEALEACTGARGFSFPLEPERFELELKGVPVGVANAVRRAFYEMPGRSLDFDLTDYDMRASNALFMEPGFVQGRVRQVPLNPRVEGPGLVWKLDMTNPPGSTKPVRVYTGDLELVAGELHEPLFNVLHPLCILQPGNRIKIDNIRVRTGTAAEFPGYLLSVTRPTAVPLDLAQFSRKETHTEKGAARYQSGYKVKSELAAPRHFLITGLAQAVPNDSNVTGKLVLEACEDVVARLKAVKDIATRPRGNGETAAVDGGSYFQILPGEDSSGAAWHEGTLVVEGETATVGEALACIALELYPKVGMASGRYVEHEKSMTFLLNHPTPDAEGIAVMLSRVIDAALEVFGEVRDGVRDRVVSGAAKAPKKGSRTAAAPKKKS